MENKNSRRNQLLFSIEKNLLPEFLKNKIKINIRQLSLVVI